MDEISKKWNELENRHKHIILMIVLVQLAGGILFWILGKNFLYALFYWLLIAVMIGCIIIGCLLQPTSGQNTQPKSNQRKKRQ